MQHAATGTLSAADEARIVQKMKIKPEDIAGWLYSLKPERISLEHLGRLDITTSQIFPTSGTKSARQNQRTFLCTVNDVAKPSDARGCGCVDHAGIEDSG